MKAKGKEWSGLLDDSIREGLNYAETNKKLVEALGEEGQVSGAAYGKHKKKLTGGVETDGGLLSIGKRQAKEETVTPPRPAWNKGKQKAADESKLAELINQGVFSLSLPFCASKELKQEDVQAINLGGGIVGAIQYFVPGINLDHPAIVLVTRVIMFYLKFRQLCSTIKAKIADKKASLGGDGSGIKEDWGETLK